MLLFYELLSTLDEEQRSFVEELYEKYRYKIKKIALVYVKNEADADEVLQTVMINIINHISKFQNADVQRIESQIVVYSRNAAINRYNYNLVRQKKVISTSEEHYADDDTVMDIPDDTYDVEHLVVEHEIAVILQEILKKLPTIYRDVVNLYYYLDYSYVEISEILEISVNAVGLRLRKAKKLILKIAGGKLDEYSKK